MDLNHLLMHLWNIEQDHLILQNFTDSKNQNIQIGAIIMDFANAVGIIVSFTN